MSNQESKFLEIVDLKKGFGSGETRQEVLRGMNFSVAKGEFCVLLGPSGSGKSTLLNIIGGIDSADSGYIAIHGDKLEDLGEKELTRYRRTHLGYVFQMYNLIANLNVKENIEVGAYLSDDPLDIDDLLHTLGLYEHRYKLPNQLSGGQQQRVSIGRAIVKNPDILLCDEPTGALDYNTSKEILKLIEDVNKKYGNTVITMDEALAGWMKTLEDVFPTVTGKEKTGEAARVEEKLYDTDTIYICDHKLAQPEVFIPVFPGTNCEYDSTKAFERAGAKVVTKVFKNLSAQDIRESVEEYKKEIAKAQIIMFPGGFSAGDEPDGSAKFFATVFRNAVIKEEVEKLLNERDGLMLGICNGFQALIKLGLVPEGKITEQKPNSPTLAMNTIGRHISKMVYTKVMTNKSPWLAEAKLGGVYCNPASHGEGRFVADEAWLHRLIANGQVATQYVDDKGNVTMDEYWNPNGSYMAIEGITSPDGRILGKMAHSERRGEAVAMNIYGEQDMKIFESGVKYFK